ncbi:hypothetical protein [Nocardia pseudovaccinii]|uniref:hypothetical protein n=1 Tax=Nocardia pseudovaccinii TaxID=189540 RepID=UPI0007A471EB|nr:hypothetical protein [Nocardia pseudovaccinii]
MSDSFLLATRIRMTRADFERWLDTPAPDPSAIANPEAMYHGWFWDGKQADWQYADVGRTPREFFADTLEGGGHASTYVVLHRDGALEAYLMHFGFIDSNVYTALLMFAAAGRFSSEPSTVLFWAETSGSLCDAEWPGWLAVLAVGAKESRFIAEIDLTSVVADLRPAEARFFDLIGRLAEAEESSENLSESYFSEIARDPLFADPAIFA